MGEIQRRRILYSVIACVLALAAVGIILWRHHGRRGTTNIPLTIMKGTGFLGLKAHVNDREILMVVDTAANLTLLDVALIEELQLTRVQRPAMSFRLHTSGDGLQTAHVDRFRVGNVVYNGDFCFADLSRPNEGLAAAGDQAIQGLLGADLLTQWNARIDYKHACLVLETR
jgi:hypothetical protein